MTSCTRARTTGVEDGERARARGVTRTVKPAGRPGHRVNAVVVDFARLYTVFSYKRVGVIYHCYRSCARTFSVKSCVIVTHASRPSSSAPAIPEGDLGRSSMIHLISYL